MSRLRLFLIFALVLLFVALPNLFYLYTEYLWYSDLGFERVFIYKTFSSIVLFLFGFVLSASIIFVAIFPVIREAEPAVTIPLTRIEKFLYAVRATFKKYYRPLGIFLGLFVSIAFSIEIASKWQDILLFINSEPYGLKVPIYNLDISFFLFRLPVYTFVVSWFKSLLLSSLLIVVFIYFLRSLTYTWTVFSQVFYWYRKHVFVLLGAYLLVESAGFYLRSFSLAYSTRGIIFGPGYVDVKYLIPFFKASAVISLVLSFLMFLVAFRILKVKTAGYLLAAFAVAYLLGLSVVPAAIQAYVVSPNELKMERQYIANHIRMTREAYDLNLFKERFVEFSKDGAESAISMDNPAIANARLWDNKPLYEVFNQIQTIRTYYVFNDIDIDRYRIDGKKTQVAISIRELDVNNLSERAKTWINLHLKYTHGYGAVVSSVTKTTREGLPELYLKDLPPKSSYEVFDLKRPQVYFGERTDNYIIVKTSEEEFAYPSGDKNVYEKWNGEGGIKLDSYIKKLAFAVRFGALKILLSKEIKDESVIHFDRNIQKRLAKIAPFLIFDSDPYPVIAYGQIYWICDAYSASNRFPYAEPFEGRFNYIRNSVKAVVDAYSGRVSLYVSDSNDPIVRAYGKLFPEMFKDISEMPSQIREHVRYPVDLFYVQAQMLSTYHMTDVQVFYNREDRWSVAEELFENSRITVEPYYVMIPFDIANPSQESEFILILPMTPAGKNNLVSWVFVASDGENYGKGGIYKFPKGSLIFGPLQVEARIDQDPEISKELTLWGQAGSRVIRGNLLVIPLKTGVIYVEPLYLKSEEGSIPELKRVIVADLEKVVMAESLSLAISKLKKGIELEGTGEEPKAQELEKILETLKLMDEKLREGDLKGFAELYEQLKKAVAGEIEKRPQDR